MGEDTTYTPGIPHDAFKGVVDLSLLPDGLYRVEGRCRDTLGNYLILSEIQSPLGTEDVTLFEILITPIEVVITLSKDAQLFLADSPTSSIRMYNDEDGDVFWIDPQKESSVVLTSVDKEADFIIQPTAFAAELSFLPTPDLQILDMYTIT